MGFDRLLGSNTTDTQCYNTVLLDGGLGTTLEDVFHKDITHPLWSAKLVDEDEESIITAHLDFLRAGSQIILTSTYQASYETFRRAQYTDADAERLMHKSVQLAVEARKRYELETNSTVDPKKTLSHPRQIALSLGPYGATLETAAEFTGKYPPPYGPSIPGQIRGTISASEEHSCEDALAAFHFSRLLVFAREVDVWEEIDIIAFETVPLVTEARAIRRAIALLEDWFRETRPRSNRWPRWGRGIKSWYITFVFPGPHGEFPQYRPKEDPPEKRQYSVEIYSDLDKWRPYTPREVAKAAVSRLGDGSPKMATPDGIGVNCTKVSDIPGVVDGFTELVKELLVNQTGSFGDELPWLVLSPNGGFEYDTIERTWSGAGHNPQARPALSSAEWAQSVEEMLPSQNMRHQPNWGGVFNGLLLGGCCKTGPDEIRALKEALTRGHGKD